MNKALVKDSNGRLKDDFGGRNVRLLGSAKVVIQLMFGAITLFADHLIKLIGY